MYVVTVTFEIVAAEFTRFLQRVRQQASDSLAEELACQRFDVCVSSPMSNRVFLYELYDDSAAFAHHLTTAHFLDFDVAVKDWIVDKQVATWLIDD